VTQYRHQGPGFYRYMRGYVIRQAAWDRELAAEVDVNRIS